LPSRRRLPPALEGLLRETAASFGRQISEILTNSVAHAADDALERIEARAEELLGGIKRARGVAQKRGRRGRRG
jgi:hypothetical protein